MIFVTVLLGPRLVIFVFVFLVIFLIIFLLFVAELETIIILELLEGLDSGGEAGRLEALFESLCTNVSILVLGKYTVKKGLDNIPPPGQYRR